MAKENNWLKIKEICLLQGAQYVERLASSTIIPRDDIRAYCEQNACGCFNLSWSCPPGVGPLSELTAEMQGFATACVIQNIYALEDSFDWPGMMQALDNHNDMMRRISSRLRPLPHLVLGAGTCRYCTECSYMHQEACRYPEHKLASVEAYGIDVKEVVESVGLSYINGQNTVSYVGIIFLQ